MSTLGLIIKNIVKTETDFFSPEYKNDGANGTIRIYFHILLSSDLSIKQQYKFFKETPGSFLMSGNENVFIDYFCRVKKTYNVLNRFAYNYKYKRAKIVADRDLCLNELKITDPNVICIYQDNARYLFHVNDMIQIIDTSLTNAFMFFSEPMPIKNPYNNLPFNKSTLYNIYFFIKFNTRLYPELLIKFYNCSFNLTEFKHANEYLLREYSIRNFVYKSSQDDLVDEINDMIEQYNTYCKSRKLKNKITIDDEFPKDKMIKIFQPYLILYITSKYAFLEHDRSYNLFALRTGLLRFNKFNPIFGRKVHRIQYGQTKDFKRKICGKIVAFNDAHIGFNRIEKQNREFLSDHLTCRTRNFVLDEPVSIPRYTLFSFSDNRLAILNNDVENNDVDSDAVEEIDTGYTENAATNDDILNDDDNNEQEGTEIEDIYNTNNSLNIDDIDDVDHIDDVDEDESVS
jgi:hypothetical protein